MRTQASGGDIRREGRTTDAGIVSNGDKLFYCVCVPQRVLSCCTTVSRLLHGADVRSVMDGLISGGGPRELVLGEGGQPATTGTMDEEEGELGAPAGRKAGAAGEAGAERSWASTMMAGADVGLDSLEYVPLSLSKVWGRSVNSAIM